MTSVWTKKRSQKSGKAPGTLVHVGDVHSQKTRIECVIYSPTEIQQIEVQGDIRSFFASHPPSASYSMWLNVEGLHDVEIINEIGSVFGIGNLSLEDIVDTSHRPKLEEFSDHIFIIIRALGIHQTTLRLFPEQISLVLGANFLITFRERTDLLFQPIKKRMELSTSRIRNSGVDYLLYSVVDLIVDNYFDILENIAERMEIIEHVVVKGPSTSTLESIHQLKTDLLFLRKSVWPLREISNRMIAGDMSYVKDSTKPYLRDVLDHAIHAVDTVETFRDIISGMLDIYLSAVSNRLNETMKVLTIIATIFIPLTFLCGWYGMNFKYMPELDWTYGYPMVIAIASITAITMLIAFRRKKWI